MKQPWYEVDKEGLRKVLARRDKAFIVNEMLQNCWDQNVAKVEMSLEKITNRQAYKLIVRDDDPEGFIDLSHAFTLYADSTKKNDPSKRGRFNLGEKLVLACCEEASIITTSGGVVFAKEGRKMTRQKTDKGSVFEAIIKMTKSEYDRVCDSVNLLIAPSGIETYYNGQKLKTKKPIKTFEATLPTEVSDLEGQLKKTQRKTTVEIYKPLAGEIAHLFEMGIPVVDTADTFHVNIMQKIPLNMDRDNVTPSYLKKVRTLVLNNSIDLLDEDGVNAPWVREASSDPNCIPDAVNAVLDIRYGKDRVSFDPSDPESNKRAVAEGYKVVHGSELSKDEWANARKAGTIKPAGRLFPTPKQKSSPDGVPPIDTKDYTDNQRTVVEFTKLLAFKLMKINISVEIYRINNKFSACYGHQKLSYNLNNLGESFFSDFPNNLERVLSLMIHEFGHEYCDDHLSENYYEALTDLGAKMTQLALNEPELFKFKNRNY